MKYKESFIHSDGQAVASRLAKSLQKVSKTMKKQVADYNSNKFDHPSTTSVAEVSNLSSEIYKLLEVMGVHML